MDDRDRLGTREHGDSLKQRKEAAAELVLNRQQQARGSKAPEPSNEPERRQRPELCIVEVFRRRANCLFEPPTKVSRQRVCDQRVLHQALMMTAASAVSRGFLPGLIEGPGTSGQAQTLNKHPRRGGRCNPCAKQVEVVR